MEKEGADLLVLTALDEVAWMLNLRGNDIPYNPGKLCALRCASEQLHSRVDSVAAIPIAFLRDFSLSRYSHIISNMITTIKSSEYFCLLECIRIFENNFALE